jgi:hypothetical protein
LTDCKAPATTAAAGLRSQARDLREIFIPEAGKSLRGHGSDDIPRMLLRIFDGTEKRARSAGTDRAFFIWAREIVRA